MADQTIVAYINDNSTSNSTGVVATVQTSSANLTIAASSIPPNSIENMADVDFTGLSDGSLLIYKNNTAKWTASRNLDAQNMEGGEF